ncbi:MAG: hypothetical protein JXQ75_04145 [Phycisphaerae bacterium]|nr:hypothetical protein [Phycisphaerae bacterium]
MTLYALVALIGPLLAAFVLVGLLCPTEGLGLRGLLLRVSLTVGLAFGLSSCGFFLWLVMVGAPGRAFAPVELTGMLALSVGLLVAGRHRKRSAIAPPDCAVAEDARMGVHLLRGLCLVLVLSVAAFVLMTCAAPHGSWDGWAIWNLRARFLFRGGGRWADGFSEYLAWSHPDYPLLLPASIARFWSYLGVETTMVPAAVAMLFTFATVGLAGASVSILRGRSQGLLAGLTLLGTGYYVRHGAYQYADTPLSFFVLAAVVLLCLRKRASQTNRGLVFLAGMMMGFAAWTKNEGLLLVASIIVAHLAIHLRRRALTTCIRHVFWLLLGAAPILGIVTYFKLSVAPANDLLSAQGFQATLGRLCGVSRYAQVGEFLLRRFISYGEGMPFVLAACFLLLGRNPNLRDRRGIALALIVLFLMLSGYFLVYVVTPHDLAWHLRTSAKRLFLHLFPTAVFVFFMLVATPEEASRRPARTHRQ